MIGPAKDKSLIGLSLENVLSMAMQTAGLVREFSSA
jgi:hypothetical protein